MSTPRQSLGKRGEDWIADRLCRAGYTILDRNWRRAAGELDIVARRAETIIFIEVRTRRGPLSEAIQAAQESVNARKLARLQQLADLYLAEHNLEETSYRIDVAAVGVLGSSMDMEVIRDAGDW